MCIQADLLVTFLRSPISDRKVLQVATIKGLAIEIFEVKRPL